MNVPNMLSILRLCLVPVFVLLYFSGLPNARIYAALVYTVAVATDYLDGFIARKYNLITNLGRVLDPLGDKMFTFAVLSCLSIEEIIPLWTVILFFIKELTMGIGGLVIHRKGRKEIPSSNIIGKTATVLFFVVCVTLLVSDVPKDYVTPMIGMALGISLLALGSYLISFFRIMKQS